MTKTPDNAAAREVERLRSWNADLDEQIEVLMATKLENAENIGLLLTVANWVETAPADSETSEAESPATAPAPAPIKVKGAELVKNKITRLEEAELTADAVDKERAE